MTDADRQELLRDLLGELAGEAHDRLAARLAAEPELARARAELAARWQALELPPATPVPPGFARRVRTRARREDRLNPLGFGVGWLSGAAAAGLLAAGVALGLWLGGGIGGGERGSSPILAVTPPAAPAAPRTVATPDAPGPVTAQPTAPTPAPRSIPDQVAAIAPESTPETDLGFAGDTFADAYLALLAEEDVAQ